MPQIPVAGVGLSLRVGTSNVIRLSHMGARNPTTFEPSLLHPKVCPGRKLELGINRRHSDRDTGILPHRQACLLSPCFVMVYYFLTWRLLIQTHAQSFIFCLLLGDTDTIFILLEVFAIFFSFPNILKLPRTGENKDSERQR